VPLKLRPNGAIQIHYYYYYYYKENIAGTVILSDLPKQKRLVIKTAYGQSVSGVACMDAMEMTSVT